MSMDRRHPNTPSDILEHAAWLRRLAGGLTRDDAAAEDAVQDTWLAFLRRPPTGDSPQPWLATVLRNFLRLRNRAARAEERKVAAAAQELAAANPLPTPETLLERHHCLRLLAELVSALEEPYRSTILLWSQEGLEPTEIARRQGVPAGTVRWRLKRGLDELRARMDAQQPGGRKAWLALLGPAAAKSPLPRRLLPLGKGALLMSTKAKAIPVVVAFIAMALVGWRWSSRRDHTAAVAGPKNLRPSSPHFLGTVQPGRLAGRVVDTSGAPLPGAVVLVRSETTPTNRTTFTSRDGSFEIESVPAGDCFVSANAAGYEPAEVGPLLLRPGAAATDVVLRLKAGGVLLRGRVSDSGGGYVPNVRIVALKLGLGRQRPTAGVADGEGRYRLSLAPGDYTVAFHADGYAPAVLDPLPISAAMTRDVRLHPAARLTGRVVVRADGSRAEGAEVRLVGKAGVRAVTADGAGEFAISDVAPGLYELSARKGDLAGRHARALSLTVAASPPDILIELGPSVEVAGRVRTAVGTAIPDATVELAGATTLTDHEGAFRFQGVLPGDLTLTASARGLAPKRQPVAVRQVDVRGIDVVLSAGAVVEGRVTGPEGNPVAGAQVLGLVRVGDGLEVENVAEAVTAANGAYRLEGLPAGKAMIRADHVERGSKRVDGFPLTEERPARLDLRLEAPAYVSGLVRYPDGTPAAGVVVRGYPQPRGGMLQRGGSTDGAGHFRLGPFGPSTVRLMATATEELRLPHHIIAGPYEKDVALIAGENDGGELVMRKPGTGTIAGQVLAADGAPAPGVPVRAVAQSAGAQQRLADAPETVTGPGGEFHLDGVEDGRHTLTAVQPGQPEATLRDVKVGSRGVRIQFQRNGKISGRVVRSDGQPAGSFTVGVVWAEVPNASSDRSLRQDFKLQSNKTFATADGTFTLEDLPPETYDVLVTSDDGSGRAGPLAIASGEDKKGLQIVVTSGARIRGRVLDYETGAPLAGVQVRLILPGRTPSSETDEKGEYLLEGAPVGQRLKVAFRAPTRSHTDDQMFVQLGDGQGELDAGEARLIRGQPVPRRASTGVRFSHEGRLVVAAGVQSISPAASAGLRVGDVLLTVDGKDVGGLGQEGVRNLNAGEPGQPVVYTMRTVSGELRTVRLMRVSYDEIAP